MKLHNNKLSTNLPDLYSLHTALPEHLRDNKRFIEFIEAYFEWQQDGATSPANIINKLVDAKNIDEVADDFIQYIQREVATPIPDIQGVDKRKLYKQLSDLYLSKGSLPSYEALFNLLFKDEIELYFPRVDMLKPSDGLWDNTANRYRDNNGFLSDRKYIQDSYYYQDYSYVIKTSKTIESWKDIVTKILHPAGFAFFGQIKIVSVAIAQILKPKSFQPGSLAGETPYVPIIADSVEMKVKPTAHTFIRVFGSGLGENSLLSRATVPLGATYKHLDEYKFGLDDVVNIYAPIELANAEGAPGYSVKSNLMPGSLQVGLGDNYTDTTMLMARFLIVQPSDLGSGQYNEVIDLLEPTALYVEHDLQ
jgi:hypothetical protein